jgi:hypothetical protein
MALIMTPRAGKCLVVHAVKGRFESRIDALELGSPLLPQLITSFLPPPPPPILLLLLLHPVAAPPRSSQAEQHDGKFTQHFLLFFCYFSVIFLLFFNSFCF